MCHTHRLFLLSVSSICKWYSVDLNEATICARLWRIFDITTLLIYCQLLIGTAPAFVRLLSYVCCASRNPEAKTLPCVSAHYHKYIILLSAVKERLPAVEWPLDGKCDALNLLNSYTHPRTSTGKMFYLAVLAEKILSQ